MNRDNFASDLSEEELQQAVRDIFQWDERGVLKTDSVIHDVADYIVENVPDGIRGLKLQIAKTAILERVAELWLNDDGAVKDRTNIEHLTHIMEFSRYGALMQMLVVDLLLKASARVAESSPSDYPPYGLINPEAWISCAKELHEELSRKYGPAPAGAPAGDPAGG